MYLPSNGEPTLAMDTAVPRADLRVAAGGSVEFGERARDLLGHGPRGHVDLGLQAVRHVGGDEGLVAEYVRQISGIRARKVGARRAGRRGPGECLLLGHVPSPDLDLLDLLGRGDRGPDAQQVSTQFEDQRIGGRAAGSRSVTGWLRGAELEPVVAHRDLVADLAGPVR